MIDADGFRANVGIMLCNRHGHVLWARRVGGADAWQFPQGGADPGEKLRKALAREIEEEIGLPASAYRILEKRGGYTYLYPKQVRKQKSYFDGQIQTYYLCRLKKSAPDIDLNGHKNPEFRSYKWIDPEDFKLKWLPEFKRQVYRAVLLDFFGVRL